MWKSKGQIGRQKLTEVEERFFGGDGRGGCMHKSSCKNEGAPTIL